MKEYTAPGAVTVADDDNVIVALKDRVRSKPRAAVQAYRDGDHFVEITTEEFYAKARAIAAGLVSLGLQPGDRVALFSASRKEFTWVDYAIWMAGCVTVPIYESDAAEQVKWMVGDSGAKAIICENADRRAEFDKVAHELPDCTDVFVIDEGGIEQLVERGAVVDPAEIDRRVAGIRHEQLATLVYTSGTTGLPKGCEITHGNFIWTVRQVVGEMGDLFVEGSRTLMFLPLAHIFARLVQVGCVSQGVSMGYSTVKTIVPDMADYPPTWVFAVPRVFEKIYTTAEQKAGGGAKGRIFKEASKVAITRSRQQRAGKVHPWTGIQHTLYGKLVYSKLEHTFGGKLRFAISGGAPLGERLGHFFDGVGVLVLEGYGLTESTAAFSANTPEHLKIGSVGRPIPGATARIADDGEVLLRGGDVFRGYWNNPQATADAFEDGWFKTGDVGRIDDDGFLRITGRKKELIVTAGGKNVQPAGLEDVVRSNPLVSQAMVIGDAKPFIACLVTLDVDELRNWAGRHDKAVPAGVDPVKLFRDDHGVREAVQHAIDEANQTVSRAESIREFRILDEDLTVEGGELTPTLKVKRRVVMDRYASVVDDIYGSAGGQP